MATSTIPHRSSNKLFPFMTKSNGELPDRHVYSIPHRNKIKPANEQHCARFEPPDASFFSLADGLTWFFPPVSILETLVRLTNRRGQTARLTYGY